MRPTTGERWATASESREVVRVDVNPRYARMYLVFVHVRYADADLVRGEWMTGHTWRQWVTSRRARREDP